jgi:hypothetical protein
VGQHEAHAVGFDAPVGVRRRTELERLHHGVSQREPVSLQKCELLRCWRLELDAVTRPRVARSLGALEPPRRGRGNRVRVGHVGFQIQHRRAVEHVQVLDVEHAALDAEQLDRAQANRVRAVRRASRKHAATLAAAGRPHLGPPARVAVKPEQHPDHPKARQVFERMFDAALRVELDGADDVAHHRLPGR